METATSMKLSSVSFGWCMCLWEQSGGINSRYKSGIGGINLPNVAHINLPNVACIGDPIKETSHRIATTDGFAISLILSSLLLFQSSAATAFVSSALMFTTNTTISSSLSLESVNEYTM